MKLRLLIASPDSDYAEHLSGVLSEKYADAFEVSVCSSEQRLSDLLSKGQIDAALVERQYLANPIFNSDNSVRLLMALIDETEPYAVIGNAKGLKKYQRVSSIAGSVLEAYAEIGDIAGGFAMGRARITAVWSPIGGSGKTTVAMAYAANRVSGGKRTVCLSLENFSSTPAYFAGGGKSISRALEKLGANVQMFLMGIRQQDSGSGIIYFCSPENYDDMNVLSPGDIELLINAGAAETDELVIDMSSQCDERTRKVFEMADRILVVCDSSGTSKVKLDQFIRQHNVFRKTSGKIVLVNNKGAKYEDGRLDVSIRLPYVQTGDAVSVYKTLSSESYDWRVLS